MTIDFSDLRKLQEKIKTFYPEMLKAWDEWIDKKSYELLRETIIYITITIFTNNKIESVIHDF